MTSKPRKKTSVKTSATPAPAETNPRKLAAGVRSRQNKVLYRISDLINSTVNSNTLLRRIVRETVEAFDAAGGLIAFADESEPGRLRVHVDQRLDARNLRTGTLLPEKHLGTAAFTQGKPVHEELNKPAPKTEIAAPLRVEGEVTGALCVRWARHHRVTDNDLRLLTAIAAQASRVIHTARLYDRLALQTRRLENLFEVAQNLISNDPLSQVLNRVTESLLAILNVKQCTVLLVGKGHDLQLSASSGGGGGTYSQRRELGESLVEKLTSRGEPVRVLDVKKSEERRPGKSPKTDRTTSLLAVPIFYQAALVGILNVYTEKPRNYDPEEMRLLKAYASLCGVAIENARHHERLVTASEEIRHAEKYNTLQALTADAARIARNAMTSSRLVIDGLHEKGAFPAGHSEDYELLLDNINSVDRMLTIAQRISERRQPRLEWIDVNRLVDDALALCRHRLTTREIMLNRRYTSDLPRVLADPGELQQVVVQVISNAMEHMKHGGLLNVFTTLIEPPPGSSDSIMVRINVRDTGAGIPPDVAEDLMEPFNRDINSRLGIGLFVSSRVIRKYGGRFTVRNASDHGTSVSITLPAGEG